MPAISRAPSSIPSAFVTSMIPDTYAPFPSTHSLASGATQLAAYTKDAGSFEVPITTSQDSGQRPPPLTTTVASGSKAANGQDEGRSVAQEKPGDSNLQRRIVDCLVILPYKQEYTLITACPGTSLFGIESPRVRKWIQIEVRPGQSPEEYRNFIETHLRDHESVDFSFGSLSRIITASEEDVVALGHLLAVKSGIDPECRLNYQHQSAKDHEGVKGWLYVGLTLAMGVAIHALAEA